MTGLSRRIPGAFTLKLPPPAKGRVALISVSRSAAGMRARGAAAAAADSVGDHRDHHESRVIVL